MTRRRWWLAAAIALAALAGPAGPAAAEPALTLEELLEQVARHYPPLAVAELEARLAEAERLAAEGGFDAAWKTRAASVPLGYYPQTRLDSVVEVPTAQWGTTLFGGYRLGAGSFALYDGKLETNALGELRAGASVPLWRNGPIDRRRAGLERAALGVEAARAAVAEQRLDIARQAVQRYWDWVAAGRRLAVAEALLETARRRERDLADSVRLGQVAPVERVENDRAVLQREGQVVAAERALEQAAIALSLYARTPDGRAMRPGPSRLPARVPPPAADVATADDVAAALARRPELWRLEAQRAQARVEIAWARNQLAPAVDLSLVGSQDLGAGSVTRQPPELEAGVWLDVPLQTRQPRGRLEAAQAALDRLDQQAAFARDRATAEIQDARSALEAARRRIAIAGRELAVARRLEAAERERFMLGDSTMLIVNLREQATADAAAREIDALADGQRAAAALRAALGLAPAAGEP